MKYRKKPVVIEAVYWDGNLFAGSKKPQWLFDAANDRKILASSDRADGHAYKLKIVTLEGEMTAEIGDYIIQGVKGELYPCKPDIFEATHEKVKGSTHE